MAGDFDDDWVDDPDMDAEETMPVQPIGWGCEHMTFTGGPDTVGQLSGWCGCEMQPVYPNLAAA